MNEQGGVLVFLARALAKRQSQRAADLEITCLGLIRMTELGAMMLAETKIM